MVGIGQIITDEEVVYEAWDVSEPAYFIQGDDSLQAFIATHLEWPKKAFGVCGSFIVAVQFIIEKDGRISGLSLLESSFKKYGFGEEAIRVIRLTNGIWHPAILNGEPVRMIFRMPIRFGM